MLLQHSVVKYHFTFLPALKFLNLGILLHFSRECQETNPVPEGGKCGLVSALSHGQRFGIRNRCAKKIFLTVGVLTAFRIMTISESV